MDSQYSRYLLAFLVVCVVFGLSFSVVEDLLNNGVPPFFLTAVTYAIGTLTLVAARPFVRTSRFSRSETRYGLYVGVVIFLAFAFQTLGLVHTTPAKGVALTCLYVIFTPLIVMMIRRKVSFNILGLALLAFLGVMILSGMFTESGGGLNRGDMLVMMCAFSFSVQFLLLERFSASLDTLNFTTVQLFIVTIIATVISLLTELDEMGFTLGALLIMELLFMGIMVTGISFFIQTMVQRRIPATTISVLCCTELVFGVMFSFAFGMDEVTMPIIVGSLVIFVATVITASRKQGPLINSKGE